MLCVHLCICQNKNEFTYDHWSCRSAQQFRQPPRLPQRILCTDYYSSLFGVMVKEILSRLLLGFKEQNEARSTNPGYFIKVLSISVNVEWQACGFWSVNVFDIWTGKRLTNNCARWRKSWLIGNKGRLEPLPGDRYQTECEHHVFIPNNIYILHICTIWKNFKMITTQWHCKNAMTAGL